MLTKWDVRFLELAHVVAGWSKDPSTKVGAVVTRRDNSIVSLGYNGFPRGVEDQQGRLFDRAEKYPRTVHAELNAILNAHNAVAGCTLYVTPLFPCASCAGAIIQSRITRVVAECGQISNPDWMRSFEIARSMFEEAGVEFVFVNK